MSNSKVTTNSKHSKRAEVSDREQLFASEGVASNIGQRLIALRAKKGLSQRELARRAEMTNSTLSAIEQGKASPSIASLEKILNAIPVSFAQFFSDNTNTRGDVFKPDELINIDVGQSRVELLALSATSFDGCYLAKHQIEEGATVSFDWLNRGGSVAAFLIEGTIEFVIEGVSHLLLPGDSLHFVLSRNHHVVNHHNGTSTFICASFPQ